MFFFECLIILESLTRKVPPFVTNPPCTLKNVKKQIGVWFRDANHRLLNKKSTKHLAVSRKSSKIEVPLSSASRQAGGHTNYPDPERRGDQQLTSPHSNKRYV